MSESSLNISSMIVSLDLYNRNAIDAACYKYTNDYFVRISPAKGNNIEIAIEKKPRVKDTTQPTSEIIKQLLNDILDQQLRLELEKRNGRIRDIIVSHAFKPIVDLDKELGN